MIRDIFDRSNYFSKNFQLFFHRKENYSSCIGIIMSFLINVIIVYLSITMGIDLIYRKNQSATIVKRRNYVMPNLTMNEDNLVVFNYLDSESKQINNEPALVNITIDYMWQSQRGFYKIKLEQTNCRDYRPIFERADLLDSWEYIQDMICIRMPKKSPLSKIVLGGRHRSNFYGYIQSNLLKCTNSSSQTCLPEEEINRRLNPGFAQFMFIDSYVDVTDYNQPIKRFFQLIDTMFNPFFNKLSDLRLNEIQVKTDGNFVFSDTDTTTSFKMNYLHYDVGLVRDDRQIATTFISSSFDTEIYERSYQKLQNLAADIGGLFQLILFFGALVCDPFDNLEMKRMILQDIFFPKGYNDKQVSQTRLSVIRNNFIHEDNSESKAKIIENPYLENRIGQLRNPSASKKVNDYFSVKRYCRCKKSGSENEKFIELIEEEMINFIDIMGLINTSKDTIFLKRVLLNEEQQVGFEHIDKRITLDRKTITLRESVSKLKESESGKSNRILFYLKELNKIIP